MGLITYRDFSADEARKCKLPPVSKSETGTAI